MYENDPLNASRDSTRDIKWVLKAEDETKYKNLQYLPLKSIKY